MIEVVVPQPRGRGVAWLVAMLWNAGGAILGGHSPFFTAIAALAAVVFAYFFVRAMWMSTRARFDEGRFTLRSGPLPPHAAFEHPLADIREFVAGPDDEHDAEGHAVFLVTRGAGAVMRLPLSLSAFVLRVRGAKRPFFGAVAKERAAALAGELNFALEEARRASTHYRVLAAAEPAAPRREGESESEGESEGELAADAEAAAQRAARTRPLE